jgi:head-tail adaptor
MQSGRANCLLRIMKRGVTQNDYGENIEVFNLWRNAWAESWIDRGSEPVQSGEPQSAPIRNFRVDWLEVYYPDVNGNVLREDMVIEVEGENYEVTLKGDISPRRFDIILLMPDYAERKFCVIRVKERRSHQ